MLVRVLLLMPLAHLIFFEDSFLSFCVDTIYKARTIFILLRSKRQWRSWIDKKRIFAEDEILFSKQTWSYSFSKWQRYISDKIEVRLEHLDCLRVNAKSILPHGEIAKSPLASLRPPWECWIHDAKQSSSITHHWQDITVRDLSTILTRGTLRSFLRGNRLITTN